jgi:hypothetical protein
MYKVYKIYKGKKIIKRIAMQACPRLDYHLLYAYKARTTP